MENKRHGFVEQLARLVVDRRNLLFLFYIIGIIFSVFSMAWVEVETDITYYLSKDSNTRKGITVMEEEFTTFAMADLMISNISLAHARRIQNEIGQVEGVASVMFEDNQDHYRDSSGFFVILFEGEEEEALVVKAMDEILELVGPYDHSVSTSIGLDEAAQLTRDMTIVGILGVIIGIGVLIFTSQSYMEIPILLMTFGVAAILNMGTNFIFKKISFISNSVGVVLQLALAIDYAIILCHRFTEEHENLPAREAAIAALSKAIPEIASSSFTTIGGLAALAFMQFGVGKDLSAVMIKAIFLSMLSVFTLMPGLLVIFSNLIMKTKHRNFIPSVSAFGRFSIRTRFVMPPIFLIILIVSFIFSSKLPFLFGMNEIRAKRMSESQLAQDRIEEKFGKKNMLALVIPSGDYRAEKRLLSKLSSYPEVETATGLANTEAIGGYMLADPLTPRQFAELVDLDLEIAQILYSAYAINEEDYGNIVGGINNYGVALINIYQFLYEEVIQGYVSFDEELVGELEEYNRLLTTARKQLEGENYSRILLYINLSEESEETFDFLDQVYEETSNYYPRDRVFIVGESTNAQDLSSTFARDNTIISVLSVLFVVIILTFTFQSAGLPLILIAVIQASIWINFSFPYLRNQGIYFLGFLVVSSIQMGANIDYAIVITSRYLGLRETMAKDKALILALNQGFPTVITSGSILAMAGILIGQVSTDGATSVLGAYLGQGTIISMVLVIFVLPQLLYLGDGIITRTSFKLKIQLVQPPPEEKIQIKGRLEAQVRGRIDAYVDGSIAGEILPLKEEGEGEEREEENYEKI